MTDEDKVVGAMSFTSIDVKDQEIQRLRKRVKELEEKLERTEKDLIFYRAIT